MPTREELEGYDALFLAKMCSLIGANPSVDTETSEKALQLKQEWLLLEARQDFWAIDKLQQLTLELETLKRRMITFLATHGDDLPSRGTPA